MRTICYSTGKLSDFVDLSNEREKLLNKSWNR